MCGLGNELVYEESQEGSINFYATLHFGMREEEELDMHSNSNQGGQAFENSLFITFHNLAGTCTDSL